MNIVLPDLVRMYQEASPACEEKLVPTHFGLDGPVELLSEQPTLKKVSMSSGSYCDKWAVPIYIPGGYKRYLLVDDLEAVGVELPAAMREPAVALAA